MTNRSGSFLMYRVETKHREDKVQIVGRNELAREASKFLKWWEQAEAKPFREWCLRAVAFYSSRLLKAQEPFEIYRLQGALEVLGMISELVPEMKEELRRSSIGGTTHG